MIGPFAYGWKVLAIVAAVISCWVWGFNHGSNKVEADWQQKWDRELKAQSQAVASTTTEYRTEEQRRQKAANQVANDARQEQTAALTDAAVADAAGDRLRVEAGKLAATASCAPGDTGAAERGKAASRAAMVLSELLSRSDARAGELAKYADSARIAGLACNRFVEELSNTTNSARP
ncbi:DUF2514 domain-containing protein [Pseudomonas syringae]|uniref:DUF2514 domain-containing protein n=1 Tax=Pseudomonas syringae TaxID=317 RepID=UPI0018E5B17D|nr:DUF2514 domain-containing protein [Pseudomonas syringae]MBI6749703.1 DUF2514 domain-containing protein [Pseudomonas syringae]MBI6771852.1 DUF2514 domain-containing protein [Pseudomonas syringae]MBI6775163.1 DUF2514 domain-containing protein [Pseudomonas syringae]MBI6780498.1 DUF2514 domain-containing protein [Pseudomonas syringae]MBI6793068.1 DUF2514 domain-containing protein [Pseudomonas syringae]